MCLDSPRHPRFPTRASQIPFQDLSESLQGHPRRPPRASQNHCQHLSDPMASPAPSIPRRPPRISRHSPRNSQSLPDPLPEPGPSRKGLAGPFPGPPSQPPGAPADFCNYHPQIYMNLLSLLEISVTPSRFLLSPPPDFYVSPRPPSLLHAPFPLDPWQSCFLWIFTSRFLV